jgi:hypothetical protein
LEGRSGLARRSAGEVSQLSVRVRAGRNHTKVGSTEKGRSGRSYGEFRSW